MSNNETPASPVETKAQETPVQAGQSTTTSKPNKSAKKKPSSKKKEKKVVQTAAKSRAVKLSKNGKIAKTPAKKGASRKEGLRMPQLRAMNVLTRSEHSDGLLMKDLANKAEISTAMLTQGIGTLDPACRKDHDTRTGYPCLLSLGHVRIDVRETKDGGRGSYLVATASGRKAFDRQGIDKLPRVAPAPFSVRTPAQVAKDKKAAKK